MNCRQQEVYFLNVKEQMQHSILFRSINILAHFRGGAVSLRKPDLTWSHAEVREGCVVTSPVNYQGKKQSLSSGDSPLHRRSWLLGSTISFAQEVSWIVLSFASWYNCCLEILWPINMPKYYHLQSPTVCPCCRSRHTESWVGEKKAAGRGRCTACIANSTGPLPEMPT